MKENNIKLDETNFFVEENCVPEDMDYIIQSIEKNIEEVLYSENNDED